MGNRFLAEEQIDLAAQLIEVLNTGAINLESNVIYESKLTSIERLKECRDVFLSDIFALIKTSEKTDRKFDESFIYSISEDKKKVFDSLGSGYYVKFITFTKSSCFKINFIHYLLLEDNDKVVKQCIMSNEPDTSSVQYQMDAKYKNQKQEENSD